MLKATRQVISCILAVVMVFLCAPSVFGTSAVPAQRTVGSCDEDVLYSIKGEQASMDLSSALVNLGVKVDNKTTIAWISSGIEEDTHAVHVTNIDGGLITTHKLVAINSDGNVGKINALSKRSITRANVMGDTTELLNGGLVFIWAIQFEYYNPWDGLDYFRPLYMQIYYRNNAGHSVERLRMVGTCLGNEYNYPELTAVSYEDYYHEMIIDQQSLRENTYYVNTDAYRSDRVIGCVPLVFGGYVINLYYTVNGRVYEDIGDVSVFVRPL